MTKRLAGPGLAVFLLFTGCGEGRIERAKRTTTRHLVARLVRACDLYRTDFGTFPPTAPYHESENLHHYLGRKYWCSTKNTRSLMDPYVPFQSKELEGDPADTVPEPPRKGADAWGNPLLYRWDTAEGKSIKIYSVGSNGKDDGGRGDGVTGSFDESPPFRAKKIPDSRNTSSFPSVSSYI